MNLYEWNLLFLEQILDCIGFSESTFGIYYDSGEKQVMLSIILQVPLVIPMHFILTMSTTSSGLSIIAPPGFSMSSLLESNHFIATHFTTIHRELVHDGISLKKLRKIAKEWDKDKQAEFVQQMSQYSPKEIGFIDKTLKDERTTFRWNGHARKGMHAQ